MAAPSAAVAGAPEIIGVLSGSCWAIVSPPGAGMVIAPESRSGLTQNPVQPMTNMATALQMPGMVTRGSTTREVTVWGERNSERPTRVFAIDPRVRRLTYRPPFDTGKPFGADVRRISLALVMTLVALPPTPT